MRPAVRDRSTFARVGCAVTFAAVLIGCAKAPTYGTAGTGGGVLGGAGGGAGGAGGSGGRAVGTCSDAQPWTAPAAPSACTDAPPATPTTAADATLTVDAGTSLGAWNRFYEKAVAADHAHTLICSAYGRNAQNALRKAHAQAGFQYVRFHGIFNDDIAVYSEDASGAPIYDWSGVDAVYDGIVAAGMRPMVEISFTPSALASDPSQVQKMLWYNDKSPNISAPTGAAGDWGKWGAFMTAFARHLEDRYGADEVRGNWYFEVWNEPSWMYGPGDAGYYELYKNTVAGLLAADAALRVGGPAASAGEGPSMLKMMITSSLQSGTKLDFLSYHRYGDDDSLPVADVTGTLAFHAKLFDIVNTTVVKGMKFTGELLNNEFGPSWMPDISRDTEVAASYIAKTVTRLGTDPTVPAPTAYAYWAVSDLYEEIYTGTAYAFRQGNYGLMLKGDPQIPESFDVAKPSFNAFRLLHMMGDEQLGVTGGMTGDGVNAAATRSADGKSVQILVYYHVDGGQGDSTKSSVVSLTVNNLPFSGPVRVRQTLVDRGHANAYRTWLAIGQPPRPTQPQWVMLRDAAELCFYESSVPPGGGALTLKFPQSIYGVTLIELSGS